MSLTDLTERIAGEGDPYALKEIHDNRVLCFRSDGRSLRLAEYLELLSQSPLARKWCGRDAAVSAMAYDLAIDRFSRLPVDKAGSPSHNPEGPNCCYYYRAFVTHVTARFKARPPANSIEA